MDEKERKSKQEKKGNALKVSRRDFLKGAGATAIASTVSTLSPPLLTDAGAVALPLGVKEAVIQLNVNARPYRLKVKSHWTLLEVLRKKLGLTGTKRSCDRGSCGACTVILEGKAVYACSLLAMEADNKRVTTIEGLVEGEKLHPIQEAFVKYDGFQCGFCTPGIIMSVKALLDKNPHPSSDEMKEALSGNICRCSGYPKILESAMAAAQKG